jgi:hypothetical protein
MAELACVRYGRIGKMPRKQSSTDGKAFESSDTKNQSATLKEVVKQALLAILMDENANAAAKASAGRTLLEYFGEQEQGLSGASGKRGAELSVIELDREIARLGG